jgi:hypothetical protein
MPSLSQRVTVPQLGYRKWNRDTLRDWDETSSKSESQGSTLVVAALGPVAQAYFRLRLLSERFGSAHVGAIALPRMTAKHWMRGGLLISAAVVLWTFHTSFITAVSGALAALVTAAGAGVAAGVLHSLSGPDHIAGLAALAINEPVAKAVGLATVWASGHVAGQCGVGAALVFMRAMGAPGIKQVLFEKWSTIGVSVTLMIIGAAGIAESRAEPDEAEEADIGMPIERATTQTPQIPRVQKFRKLKRTFVTGFVHGLSPDGLMMLFPLLTMSASRGTMHLLGIFGGTCLSMSACTVGLSVAAGRLQRRSAQEGANTGRMQTMISLGSSFLALGFGAIMLCTGIFGTF